MKSTVGHVLLSHLYHVSILSGSCRSVPTFVSDRLLFPLDYSLINMIILSDSNCNSWLLKLIHPVHVFKRALNNFEILFPASISPYKPETSLTVLFARKVFRSADHEISRKHWTF